VIRKCWLVYRGFEVSLLEREIARREASVRNLTYILYIVYKKGEN